MIKEQEFLDFLRQNRARKKGKKEGLGGEEEEDGYWVRDERRKRGEEW